MACVAGRHLVETPPGGQECLGQDVGRVVCIVRAAQGIAEDGSAVGLVKLLEPVSSLVWATSGGDSKAAPFDTVHVRGAEHFTSGERRCHQPVSWPLVSRVD